MTTSPKINAKSGLHDAMAPRETAAPATEWAALSNGPSQWEEPPREEYPSDGFSLCSSRARATIHWSQRSLKHSEVSAARAPSVPEEIPKSRTN
jgi:hypothetical protein